MTTANGKLSYRKLLDPVQPITALYEMSGLANLRWEEWFVGNLLHNMAQVSYIRQFVQPTALHFEKPRRIYQCICDMHDVDAARPLFPAIIADTLENQYPDEGMIDYVHHIALNVFSMNTADTVGLAENLHNLAWRRAGIQMLNEQMHQLLNQEKSDKDCMIDLSAAINTWTVERDGLRITSQKQAVQDYIDGLQELYDDSPIMPTGLVNLDKVMQLKRGRLAIIGAPTSRGKSALLGHIIGHMAKERWVAYASLEMTPDEYVARLMAAETGLSTTEQLDTAVLDAVDDNGDSGITRIMAKTEKIGNLKILHLSGSTLDEILATTDVLVASGICDVLCVDYLQLVHTDAESERLRIAETSIRLKAAARRLGILVLSATQLNQDGGTFGSAEVENSADALAIISEGKHPDGREVKPYQRGQRLVTLKKNRHGKRGAIAELNFHPAAMRWYDYHKPATNLK